MKNDKVEVAEITKIVEQAAALSDWRELNDLELVLVGGGIGDPIAA